MDCHSQSHQSDPRILGRRTLQRDHRHLAGLLHPGLSVLDVGCGTGAITAGIAEAVGPRGSAIGVDRDAGLLELARRSHAGLPNLHFEEGDATTLIFRDRFDIVTAARTLQWIAHPGQAVLSMKQAARPSGLLVVLDYNHALNEWAPDPPAAFQTFYRAFLAWREAHGWDNQMANRLPELFRSAGLLDVESHLQDEVAERGQPEFDEHAELWSRVIENVGGQIVREQFLSAVQLQEAGESYRAWAQSQLIAQTLAMRTVAGRVG
jgi:ubiquinone/menaquinone biosynthesis C-methylase UbiE